MSDLLVVPLAVSVWETSDDARFRDHRVPCDGVDGMSGRPRDRRVPMIGSGYRAAIDGRQAALVNLSVTGAQLRGPIRVLPDQPTIVKIGWPKEDLTCTAIARVRWVRFEPDPSSRGGLYRVGLVFETWDVRGLKEIIRHCAPSEAPKFRIADSW